MFEIARLRAMEAEFSGALPGELLALTLPGCDSRMHRRVVQDIMLLVASGQFVPTGEPDRMPCGCAALWVIA